jgi:hypothetical protein
MGALAITGDRLADVFHVADIDDITLNPEADVSEQIEIVLTERATGDSFQVAARSLDDALDEALSAIEDKITYSQLRSAGLTEDEIENLTGVRYPDADHSPTAIAWRRGYQAGASETAELYAEAIADRAAAAVSEPALAAAGEPFGSEGAYLALVVPVQVARA